MAAVPKRRTSTHRKGKRRAGIKLDTLNVRKCKQCGHPTMSHVSCKNCGTYK